MRMRGKIWLRSVVLGSVLAFAGCADDGKRLDICENPELECDDGNACTEDRCDPDIGCLHEPIGCNDFDACTRDSCDAASGCVFDPLDCNDGNACTSDRCDAALGCRNTDVSAACDDSDVCTTDSCDPATGCVNAGVDCDDDNDCTAESCDAVSGCSSVAVADGTVCDRGLGRCQAGMCEAVGCTSDAQCDDDNACTANRCDLETNRCVNPDISESCDDGDACTADSCDPASGCVNEDDSARCDDDNECTVDACQAITGCSNVSVDDGTACDGGAGECTGGVCFALDRTEYQQNFESLNRENPTALADDGWTVYGNVFDSGTMDFLYGYGPFVAPNDGAAFSAIVTGQGGVEQGEQQLAVYSDYNNADHAGGRLIESIFYRERAITAADSGRTITFSFDAKRGNINDPGDPLCPCTTTAVAFIKTLNPAAGFATTNLIVENTTALPDSWGRYSITLPVVPALVDQLLQVGFSSTATLYQPSGNFYDNLEVRSSPTGR